MRVGSVEVRVGRKGRKKKGSMREDGGVGKSGKKVKVRSGCGSAELLTE